MTFGLSKDEFEVLNGIVIEPLKKMSCRVFIFGSRATGTNHPFSDVDLLFEPTTIGQPTTSALGLIKEAIEESRFPIKVDLVCSDDLAKSYRDRVFAERIEL